MDRITIYGHKLGKESESGTQVDAAAANSNHYLGMVATNGAL